MDNYEKVPFSESLKKILQYYFDSYASTTAETGSLQAFAEQLLHPDIDLDHYSTYLDYYLTYTNLVALQLADPTGLFSTLKSNPIFENCKDNKLLLTMINSYVTNNSDFFDLYDYIPTVYTAKFDSWQNVNLYNTTSINSQIQAIYGDISSKMNIIFGIENIDLSHMFTSCWSLVGSGSGKELVFTPAQALTEYVDIFSIYLNWPISLMQLSENFSNILTDERYEIDHVSAEENLITFRDQLRQFFVNLKTLFNS